MLWVTNITFHKFLNLKLYTVILISRKTGLQILKEKLRKNIVHPKNSSHNLIKKKKKETRKLINRILNFTLTQKKKEEMGKENLLNKFFLNAD